jgi:PPM family protein phosphatase
MMSLDIAAITKQGSRRYQEDNYGSVRAEGLWCVVVADGAGGHGGGHIASQLAVRAVLEAFSQIPVFTADAMHQLLMQSHYVVKAGQQQFERYPDMRSTVIIALVDLTTGRVMFGNIGDSRGYAYIGSELLRTRDHTIVQQMIDAGMYTDADAPRSRITATLMASLGSPEDPKPFVFEAPKPLKPKDFILLCTDGWWGTLDPSSMRASVADDQDLDDALGKLSADLEKLATDDQDNFTALVARLEEADESDPSEFAPTQILQRGPGGTWF